MKAYYGHMNFFEVTECGLYRYNDPASHGCELKETLQLIKEWVKGRSLAETLPWDADNSRTGLAKCYCQDLYEDEATGDVLLVLWKSESDSTGAIWGAQENGKIGSAQVVKYTDNYKGNKMIWGRPMYYWIIPKKNIVISIKFDFSLCDSYLFQSWVSACITNRVQHKNRVRSFTDGNIVRLHITDGTKDSNVRYRYGFDVALKTVSTSMGELNKIASKVTHILKRETVTLAKPKDERAEWVKFFDKLPYLPAKPKSQKRQIEIRAEAKPSAAEMREIIEQFAREDRKRTDWDNVGFITEDGLVWVDRFRLKSGFEVLVDPERAMLGAVELWEEIEKHRTRLLAPLNVAAIRTAKAA